MAQKCIACGHVSLTWAQVKQAIAAMINAGLTPAEAKRRSPRCLRCTQQLLATVSRVSTDEPKVPVASDKTEEFPPQSKYPTAPDDDSWWRREMAK
jgi:hypothetical protein